MLKQRVTKFSLRTTVVICFSVQNHVLIHLFFFECPSSVFKKKKKKSSVRVEEEEDEEEQKKIEEEK